MSGKAFAFRSAQLGELADASADRDDSAALRRRLSSDGYLLLRGLLDRDAVLAARRACVAALDEAGCLAADSGADSLAAPIASDAPDPPAIDPTQPPIWALFRTAETLAFFSCLFNEEAMVYPKTLVRVKRTGGRTGIHYDSVYAGDGSPRVLTLWAPLGDVGVEEGAVALCEGSHAAEGFARLRDTYGRHNPDRDSIQGADNAPGHFSWDLEDVTDNFGGRWLTADFRAGDALIFGRFMMHCGLENETANYRISADARYQPLHDPTDARFMAASGDHATLRHRYEVASRALAGRTMEQARKDWELPG